MRAALLHGDDRRLEVVDDVEIAAPGPGQVRVEIRHCGLCHSDLSFVNGQFPPPGPMVLGHEASGVVAEVGPGVTSLEPGDPVMISPVGSCGRCYWCVRGEHSICVNAQAIVTHSFADGTTGLSRHGDVVYRGVGVGGFAEQALVLESAAVKVELDVPLEVVSVIGCAVQTGVGAVLNTARVEEGATVLVAGLGGIGVAIVQGARLAGASRIIVSDPVAERRDAAERFGATDAIDPTTQDVVGEVMRLTGVGVDYAFEAVGSAKVAETLFWATRNGGALVVVGAGPLDESLSSIPLVLLVSTQKRILGSWLGGVNSQREIPRLIDLWRAGRLDLESMVTAHRPLEELGEAAADMQAGRGLRTLIDL